MNRAFQFLINLVWPGSGYGSLFLRFSPVSAVHVMQAKFGCSALWCLESGIAFLVCSKYASNRPCCLCQICDITALIKKLRNLLEQRESMGAAYFLLVVVPMHWTYTILAEVINFFSYKTNFLRYYGPSYTRIRRLRMNNLFIHISKKRNWISYDTQVEF